MLPTQLAGDIGMPVPNVTYADAWRWILEHHTRLITAQNSVAGAQYSLTLAHRTPWVPDLDLGAAIQRDFTTLPDQPMVYSIRATVPLPLFDRNRGNILAAEGALAAPSRGARRRAIVSPTRWLTPIRAITPTRLRWTTIVGTSLATRCNRGEACGSGTRWGPGFRAVYRRRHAQQTLAQTIQSYTQTLAAQWQAVVDLADLMEVDDLCQLGYAGYRGASAGGGDAA